jgi:hypothetical protein
MKKRIKKTKKIAIGALVILVIAIASVSVYYYTRPKDFVPSGIAVEIRGNVYNPANVTWNYIVSNDLTIGTLIVNITSNSNPQENGQFGYTSVSLRGLVNKASPAPNATSVTVIGSDGSSTLITGKELNEKEDSIGLSFGKDNKYLTPLKNGGEGPLRLIIATDNKTDRWIKDVVLIIVN